MISSRGDSVRFSSPVRFVAVFLFFVFFFISFLQRPVYNYDFWWHLATGKYIVETHSLPQNDPFAYTSHMTSSPWKTMVLKGNWLAEVIFYEVYFILNLKGIIVLRSLLMLLFLWLTFLSVRKQGVFFLLALALTTAVFTLSKGYLGERPQLFTFVFFASIFYLLEEFGLKRSKRIFLIPPIFLISANTHPGYIISLLLLTIYLIGEGWEFFFSKQETRASPLKSLFVVWVLSVVAIFCNPSGLSVFHALHSVHQYTEGIVEFMPTFSLYARKVRPVDYPYVAFLLLSLASLRYIKKIGLIPMILLVTFTLLSFISIRLVIFYMCVTSVVLAKIAARVREENIFSGIFTSLERKENLISVGALLVGAFLTINVSSTFKKYEFGADTFFAVPKNAADFLERADLKGNIFNEYGFGGYLIWRLYPKKKVFIDGRTLELDVFKEYKSIISASGYDASWQSLLAKYDITCIVSPPLMPHGELYPIVEALLERDDWLLIYRDHLSLIFLKNDSQNKELAKNFSQDRLQGYSTVIVQAAAGAKKNPTNPYYLITLGKVFLKMGKIDDAKKAFMLALERDPKNPVVAEWLRKVREKG